jgi:hypothetical protein
MQSKNNFLTVTPYFASLKLRESEEGEPKTTEFQAPFRGFWGYRESNAYY